MFKKGNSIYIIVIAALLFGFSVIGSMCYIAGQMSMSKKSHFNRNTQELLHGYKLDLPEDISNCKDLNDSEPDYLTCVRDSVNKIIYLKYDPTEYSKIYHEYQIEFDNDSITLFDLERLIGKVPYQRTALDTLIMSDPYNH